MGEITELLLRARAGESGALAHVFDALYPELRRLAQARVLGGERTLTPTVLVHEAYLRLIGNAALDLNDRRHFLACAARAMRAIVIDHVRRRHAEKRGGQDERVPLDAIAELVAAPGGDTDLLALDAALDRLDAINPRQRELVELRYFGGVEFGEIAELFAISERTAKREWERARAFLYAQLG